MKLRHILIGIAALIVIAVAGFVIWGSTPLPAHLEAESAAQEANVVAVDAGDWIAYRAEGGVDTGFIFYPGGRVDPAAYAPPARSIASAGYLVVIVPMPLNLAVLDANAAADVIAAFPDIEHWAIGGHSLGGSMAANFAAGNPGSVEGLALWASYPAASDDLSASGLAVVSITGSADTVLNQETFAETRALLPADTVYVEIEGGNHAGFGWYGPQRGDGESTIPREEQQAQVIAATLAMLNAIGE